MAKNDSKRGLDEQLLEGGGGGGGAGISGTKWSKMPSFKSNASFMDDVKKLTKDTSHLKGGAKKSTDLAEDRAAARMGVRAAGAGTAAAIAKGISGSGAAAEDKPQKSDDYENGDANYDSSNPTGVSGKGMKKGGSVSASRRGDGIAQRGKTKGRFV